MKLCATGRAAHVVRPNWTIGEGSSVGASCLPSGDTAAACRGPARVGVDSWDSDRVYNQRACCIKTGLFAARCRLPAILMGQVGSSLTRIAPGAIQVGLTTTRRCCKVTL
jgi:hypothetical protein